MPSSQEKQPRQPAELPAGAFIDELVPADWMVGQAPLFGLQLTAVREGSVLGLTFSHAIAGNFTTPPCLSLPVAV